MTDYGILVGTDNGFIAGKPIGAAGDFVAFEDSYDPRSNADDPNPNSGAHCKQSLQIEQIAIVPNDHTKVIAQLEGEYIPANKNFLGMASSANSGATWARTSVGATPFYFNQPETYGLLFEALQIEESGSIWGLRDQAPNTWHWLKSPDYTGATFVDQFVSFWLGPRSAWLSDGYIWDVHKNLSGQIVLSKQATNGGSTAAFTFVDTPASFGTPSLSGQYGTNRLVISAPDTQFNPSLYTCSIDITNPAAPTHVWSANQPFGANRYTFGVLPIDHNVVIANTVNNTFSQGDIWKSTDGGVTWIQKVANTAQLRTSSTSAGGLASFVPDTGRIAVSLDNPDVIAVAMIPPYVYVSMDRGDTWSVETIDMSIFTPFGGVAPSEWLCVAVYSAVSQRLSPFVTLIGAT